MQFKYGLDERPPLWETFLVGLQWFAITIPTVIVIGKITGEFHFKAVGDQMVYIQKLIFVMALAQSAQLLWGHRMPLIAGPSSILLVGIITALGHQTDTIYTAILIGGLVFAIASASGLLGRLKYLFTPRVVAVVLILIAFTLAPTIVNLITVNSNKAGPLAHLVFSLFMVFILFTAQRLLPGIWKSTLIIWAMIGGTLAWSMISPDVFKLDQILTAQPAAFFS